MLTKKKTLLTLHETQHTEGFVYFQYEGDDDSYRVGYYLPLNDWFEMENPEVITVTVKPGDTGMKVGLRDQGERSDWSLDTNHLLEETARLENERQRNNG